MAAAGTISQVKGTTPANAAANTDGIYFDQTLLKPCVLDESGNIGVLCGLAIKDYRLVKVTDIFQGTITYTPSAGVTALFVEGVGGGAGGGGVANAATNAGAAGGGGAGGYSAVWSTSNVAGAHTVQVGAGGNGGTAGANNGSVGTDTTFADTAAANILTAKGGSGGIADTVAAGPRVGGLGGAGGAQGSGVGDMKGGGAPGDTGLALAAAQAISGKGGDSAWGGGGIGAKAQATGSNAALYGAGGGGGCILSGGASVAGGNGSNGILRVWEFAG